jgi:hypothetical protein
MLQLFLLLFLLLVLIQLPLHYRMHLINKNKTLLQSIQTLQHIQGRGSGYPVLRGTCPLCKESKVFDCFAGIVCVGCAVGVVWGVGAVRGVVR